MDPITSSHLPIEVEIRIGSRVRLFVVRPATVREAIGVMDAAAAMRKAEDEDAAHAAWEHLRRVVMAWLPIRIASALVARSADREDAARIATVLLSVGMPESTKKAADAAKARAKVEGWSDVVSDVMRAFSMTFEEVMSLPFIAFVALSARVPRVYAAEMLRTIQVRSLPYIKDESERRRRIDQMLAAAGAKEDAPPADAPAWMQDPDEKARKREEMMRRAIEMRALWHQKAGEA